jgi:DNA replication and repair protein RecF
VSLHRIELLDFRTFTAGTFTPEREGTTVISGPNGTGKTSVLEAMVYLGTQRSFRGAPREAMVRTGAERGIIRAELHGESSPTLVEAEILLAGRSRTQINRKTASGRKDLAVAAPCTIFSPEDLALVSGGPQFGVSCSMTRWAFWTARGLGRPTRWNEYCANAPRCYARRAAGSART